MLFRLVFRTNDPDFTIIDTNRMHSGMAMIDHDEVVGKGFFKVFPDVSDKFKKTGVSDLRESFRRVIKTGKPDTMEVFRYDIRQPDGTFVERFWRPTHYPLLDTEGKLSFIVQVSQDVTEEVYTERRLAAAQKRLDEALEIGQVGSWVWDVAANKVIADPMLSRLFGVSTEEGAEGLALETFTNAIHPDDRDRVQKRIAKTLETNGTFESEYRTVIADGSTRWVLARGRIDLDADGKGSTFPGVIVDITARKEAEEKFKQQAAFVQTITGNIGEGVFALDKEGKVTYVNKAAQEILGWSDKELMGISIHEKIHYQREDGTPMAREDCDMLQILKTGKATLNAETAFTCKDGSIIIVQVSTSPILKDDKMIGLVQSFSDITERRQAAHNLQFLSQASKTLSSSLDYKITLQRVTELCVPQIADWCSIELLDDDGDLQQVGLGHVDPSKIAWALKLRDEYPANMDAPAGVPQVIRTGQPEIYPVITREMIAMSAKDEKHLEIISQLNFSSVMIVPLAIEGKTIGAITFANTEHKRSYTNADYEMAQELAVRASIAITNANLYRTAQEELAERERLEAKLRDVNEQLEERVKERTQQLEATNQSLERSNRELQDFAYVASHDLQEPLRKIQAFGNLLESEFGAQLGDGKDYLKRMRSAASRMSILIEDLLAFSRVTTKARPFANVGLTEIATEVAGDLETRIADTGGKVTIDDLPTIKGDPVQMRQLLQNLIANALKFHKPDSTPEVHVYGEAILGNNGKIKEYQVCVADNGIGFDEKYLDRIFAVFQRLHGHESYEGTGIGLAVCRKIVERHGGSITARSKAGEGSTFIITLPAKPPKEV